jgi:3'-phosphoadenosine 5'-phosphosulfate sulfotransferase (PAPS reductase)/FAD synthetase
MLTESKVTDYVEGTVLNFSRLNKQRILFVRNYFKGLVSFYKTAYRLKPAIGRLAIKIFEKTVFSRIGCWVLCPLANLIFKSARENKFLSKINALLKSYKQRRKALYIRNSF